MTSSRSEHLPAPSRWSVSAALLVGWVVVVLLLAYFLEVRPRVQTGPPSVATVPTAQADFPAPPEGAVVFSRELGDDALALGVVPEEDRVIVQASVVGPEGEGVSGLDVTFASQGKTASGRSCGVGCYRAALATVGRPATVDLVVDGDESVRWSVVMPAAWPPTSATRVLARAERVWRLLRSLSFDETLRSNPRNVLRSSWRLQAPDRLAYRIVDGASAVVVGKRRWDKVPGKPWKASDQQAIRQPTPLWAGTANAHVVGTAVVRGRPAVVVTFFDPKTPGWFTAVVGRESFRTYEVRMVATAHFMRDRYHSFDETPAIRPPTS